MTLWLRRSLLLVALLLTPVACDDAAETVTTSTTEPGSTSTSTPAGEPTASCGQRGDIKPASGPADGGLVFVTGVAARVSDPVVCGEHVVFELEKNGDSELGFEIGYSAGPFEDVSGAIADVEGEAFLRIALANGTTADLSSEEPRITFEGQPLLDDDLTFIRDVVLVSDFEGASEWVIGLDAERNFEIGAAHSDDGLADTDASDTLTVYIFDVSGSPE